ncbi:uncharacterized protein LOC119985132 isoform X2 [Tripterygium wilfordii]|uniref:uncharacterized protein LOC119985132 isoform X2 n=1 Tax=Tripterygium wilfordii TaxID=458696 RepID=UPI0018F836CD|nr:uncharacterized protein LOC119985132 isoform X2 [Tripterygium wilfordii]
MLHFCKLDYGSASDCGARKIFYTGLQDGNHTFEVCTNGSQGVGCASYNWTVDTIPPTAYVTASAPITNALNVSVDILFTEPCTGDGGFRCSSVNACNLLVYGAGHVIPSSLIILQPNLKYSLLVGLSSTVVYGRVILVMDKNFCTDAAGNRFTRTMNSSFSVHFDRRNVYVNLRTHIPEKLLQLNHEIRTVQATNDYDNLKVYLYFSRPVLNSSVEILNSLSTSQGAFLPIHGEDLRKRRFGFQVSNISSIAVVTIRLDASSIVSRQGTPVSPIAPVTFLFDSDRPAVRLSTTSSSRTKEHSIPIWIKFMKPVFGFNSSFISISGGQLLSFSEISRSTYIVEIQHVDDILSVKVPENVIVDVAGNKNLASNVLKVRHYSVPIISSVISTFATASFVATSFTAGLLTISTASLQSVGAFSRSSCPLTSDPARILFRSACHIQVFALSRWLAVTLPIDYYEFVRGLEWSIPYFSLPWESENTLPVMIGSSSSGFHSSVSKVQDLGTLEDKNLRTDASVYGSPLTPMDYRSFFESQNFKPEAEYILGLEHSNGWRYFRRSMFWLAVISGCLMLLHALLLLILKFKRKTSEKQRGYGALTFPRFEIFLIVLSLPCTCMVSTAIIQGGTPLGFIVGILLLGTVFLLSLALLLFLSFGITLGKLLQYKELHQEGEIFHWYQEIVRIILGPGKRGQWTWKNQTNSVYLTMLGPLFEDLRGPPKYMLTQISSGNSRNRGDRIIASDDENEDSEAPFIQKLFGILRIYYTLLELVKRVSLGIVAGAFLNRSSKVPTLALLCISSFQLFFLLLKKPFIKKKVQMVEIISVSCEVGLFATCFVLLEKEVSGQDETRVGMFMIILFLLGFFSQMINEWYALYRQTVQLDPAQKSFLAGLKLSSIGFLLFFIPQKLIGCLERKVPVNMDGEASNTSPPADRCRSSGSRSSGSTDKPWMKQLRELAKAGFSKDGNGNPSDPSSSRARWSGIWSAKRSGSSSVKTSSDFKPKSKALDRDLEAIFASK